MATNTTVRTISKEELSRKMRKGESVQIVNVLDPEYYKLGFIKGSKKIPLDQLGQRLSELDQKREVVTYCANTKCTASRMAAEKLSAAGFDVKAYEGGIQEWVESKLPTE
ncbi:MAG: rhodanese-like domain-containing protein [Elusimicrobia bacterium]|nr:rhodanese-like domain-containing protein [Elusimicrobiota bacterium]